MRVEELSRQLLPAFAAIPDPRSVHGRRHPLSAILMLATVAMLSGARSLYAVAQWGRQQPLSVVRALGFTRPQTPSGSTLHEVFRDLDAAAFETALRAWAQRGPGEQWQEFLSDAKRLRGFHGEMLPGVEVLVAYQAKTGLVLE